MCRLAMSADVEAKGREEEAFMLQVEKAKEKGRCKKRCGRRWIRNEMGEKGKGKRQGCGRDRKVGKKKVGERGR